MNCDVRTRQCMCCRRNSLNPTHRMVVVDDAWVCPLCGITAVFCKFCCNALRNCVYDIDSMGCAFCSPDNFPTLVWH